MARASTRGFKLERSFRTRTAVLAVLIIAAAVGGIAYQGIALTQATKATRAFDASVIVLDVTAKISAERVPTNQMLSLPGPGSTQQKAALNAARQATDRALARLHEQAEKVTAPGFEKAVDDAEAKLAFARSRIDSFMTLAMRQRTAELRRLIAQQLEDVLPSFFQLVTSNLGLIVDVVPNASHYMQLALLAADLRDQAQELSVPLMPALNGKRQLTEDEMVALAQTVGRVTEIQRQIDDLAVALPKATEAHAALEQEYFTQGLGVLQRIRDEASAGRSAATPELFQSQYTPTLDSVIAFRDTMVAYADDVLRQHARVTVFLLFATFAAFGVVVGLLSWAMRAFMHTVIEPFTRTTDALLALTSPSRRASDVELTAADEIARLDRAIDILREHDDRRRALEKEREELVVELRTLAETDSLTGLLNRRTFEAQTQMLALEPGKEWLAMIIFDIDHFKRINDSQGHATGDLAIKLVADVARSTWRSDDIVARIGGEEFAVFVAVDRPEEALSSAQRFREALAGTGVPLADGTRLHFTVSMGVTARRAVEQTPPDLMLRIADDYLYKAKNAGRDRIETDLDLSAQGVG